MLFVLAGGVGYAQGTAPTFRYNTSDGPVTLPGRDPALSGTTMVPTVLVPVRLQFDARWAVDKPVRLDAAGDIPKILASPVFSNISFGEQGTTQFLDAMLRATVRPEADAAWHTLLGQPEVRPVTVEIPAGYGYVLTSKRTGTRLGIVDIEYLQRAIFQRIPHEDGKLVIAITRNTAYYTYGDATVCCSWGTHGVDEVTGNSFVLASWLGPVPPLVTEHDVQPLTEQLAGWVNDPLHDPLFHVAFRKALPAGENMVPRWGWPPMGGVERHGCGGDSPATRYTLQDPVETNERSDLPAGPSSVVRSKGATWHVADVALMGWYTRGPAPTAFRMRSCCGRWRFVAPHRIRRLRKWRMSRRLLLRWRRCRRRKQRTGTS